jgi:hypothetical protein
VVELIEGDRFSLNLQTGQFQKLVGEVLVSSYGRGGFMKFWDGKSKILVNPPLQKLYLFNHKNCIIFDKFVGAGSPTISNKIDRLNKPAPTHHKTLTFIVQQRRKQPKTKGLGKVETPVYNP